MFLVVAATLKILSSRVFFGLMKHDGSPFPPFPLRHVSATRTRFFASALRIVHVLCMYTPGTWYDAVRLPQSLAQSALAAAEVTQVQKLLGDFLRFMQKNHATFFVQEYEEEEPVRSCWV